MMTPSELLGLMAGLGCSQAEAGELVGVGDRAMRMCRRGAKDPAGGRSSATVAFAGKVSGDDVRWALKRRPLGL
jgi:hypothetical protein